MEKIISILIISIFILSSCSNPEDLERIEELENKNKKLEWQIQIDKNIVPKISNQEDCINKIINDPRINNKNNIWDIFYSNNSKSCYFNITHIDNSHKCRITRNELFSFNNTKEYIEACTDRYWDCVSVFDAWECNRYNKKIEELKK